MKKKKKTKAPLSVSRSEPVKHLQSNILNDYTVSCNVINMTHINQLQNSHVYEAKIKGVENESSVTILQFPGQKEAQMHHNIATGLFHRAPLFRPILQFRYSQESGQGVLSSVFSVGHSQGIPLSVYIDKLQPENVWQYDSTTWVYKRAAKDFRNLGKLLGSLLYRLHREGTCIGGDLINRIFVNGDGTNTPLSLVVMGYRSFNGSEFVDGVTRDLYALREFVEYVQNAKPMKQTRAGSNQNRDDLYDLVMFYNLFPELEDWPLNKKHLLDLSYFVCHAPLFWDYEQRFSFCSTYSHLRTNNNKRKEFDRLMDFNNYPIMATWQQKVTRTQRFINVYYNPANRSLRRIGGAGVMPFHRSVQVHHARDSRIGGKKITALEADNGLIGIFPYAIPIAYLEVYKTLSAFENVDIVEFFSYGGLDYSRS